MDGPNGSNRKARRRLIQLPVFTVQTDQFFNDLMKKAPIALRDVQRQGYFPKRTDIEIKCRSHKLQQLPRNR